MSNISSAPPSISADPLLPAETSAPLLRSDVNSPLRQPQGLLDETRPTILFTDDSPRKSWSRFLTSGLGSESWLWETLALLLSVTGLAAIVATLAAFDRKQVPALPLGISVSASKVAISMILTRPR